MSKVTVDDEQLTSGGTPVVLDQGAVAMSTRTLTVCAIKNYRTPSMSLRVRTPSMSLKGKS